MTTDTTTHPTTPPPTGAVPAARVPDPPVLILDPSTLPDPAARERALVQLLRYRVELLEPIRTTWIDEDLAAEEYWEEDARVYVNVPPGTLGVITLVRRYPTRWPYVVAWDRGPECGAGEYQIARCADQSLTPAKPPAPAPQPRRL